MPRKPIKAPVTPLGYEFQLDHAENAVCDTYRAYFFYVLGIHCEHVVVRLACAVYPEYISAFLEWQRSSGDSSLTELHHKPASILSETVDRFHANLVCQWTNKNTPSSPGSETMRTAARAWIGENNLVGRRRRGTGVPPWERWLYLQMLHVCASWTSEREGQRGEVQELDGPCAAGTCGHRLCAFWASVPPRSWAQNINWPERYRLPQLRAINYPSWIGEPFDLYQRVVSEHVNSQLERYFAEIRASAVQLPRYEAELRKVGIRRVEVFQALAYHLCGVVPGKSQRSLGLHADEIIDRELVEAYAGASPRLLMDDLRDARDYLGIGGRTDL